MRPGAAGHLTRRERPEGRVAVLLPVLRRDQGQVVAGQLRDPGLGDRPVPLQLAEPLAERREHRPVVGQRGQVAPLPLGVVAGHVVGADHGDLLGGAGPAEQVDLAVHLAAGAAAAPVAEDRERAVPRVLAQRPLQLALARRTRRGRRRPASRRPRGGARGSGCRRCAGRRTRRPRSG